MSTDPAPDRVVGTATRDGRTLSWVRAGTGSPTVLLDAGIGASSSAWEPVLARLAAHTTVVAYDRVGYGDSGDGDPSPDAALRDIDAVLDAAGATDPLVPVGHSWGGVLARLYTDRHPDRVAAVVLVDATHEAMTVFTNPVLTAISRAGFAVQARSARRGRMRRRLERGSGRLGSMLAALPPAVRSRVLDELRDPRTWEQAGREFGTVRPTLRTLPPTMPAVPVVAVVGTAAAGAAERRERSMTRSAYETWLPTLPDGRIILARDSGHAVPQQEPDVVAEAVREVLAERHAG